MTSSLEELHTEADVDRALERPFALIFKHSSRCGISARALAVVRRFAETEPMVPVLIVPVIECRSASSYLAEQLGIRHQSPQAILLRRGRVLWHRSHSAISREALMEAVAGLSAKPEPPPDDGGRSTAGEA